MHIHRTKISLYFALFFCLFFWRFSYWPPFALFVWLQPTEAQTNSKRVLFIKRWLINWSNWRIIYENIPPWLFCCQYILCSATSQTPEFYGSFLAQMHHHTEYRFIAKKIPVNRQYIVYRIDCLKIHANRWWVDSKRPTGIGRMSADVTGFVCFQLPDLIVVNAHVRKRASFNCIETASMTPDSPMFCAFGHMSHASSSEMLPRRP